MRSAMSGLRWTWSLTLLLAFFAQPALAAPGIAKSVHDFSTGGTSAYKGSSDQICVYCHAPHNTTAGAPLWNHTVNSGATYTAYSNSTMNATSTGPGAVSKLCLSCHDGTIAVDSFGGAAGTGTNTVKGAANLGTDLSNDHPIGIKYDTALATTDGGLKDPTTTDVTIGTGNTGKIFTKMLYGNQVECASCHDVHNSASGTAVQAKLLRVSTAGSALCVACHNK